MFRCVVAVLAAGLLVLNAAAQALMHRPFPATALRGELTLGALPEALLNGQPARLAPGARIRGEDNLLLTPGALAGRKLLVHYTVESTTGLVHEVWVLNATERSNRLWPTHPRDAQLWRFDPVGQTWSRP